MGRIQVDMFEVQLGAALLLQFGASDAPVRVLADAGVSAAGYPVDHVHRKLPEAFAAFGSHERRLDLVIGTHYDEDHLTGLVPVISDESIAIGEAWLPPVADDSEPPPPDGRALAVDDLLVSHLAGPDGAARLARYLRAKHAVCQQSAAVERAADDLRVDRPREIRPAASQLAAPRAAGDPDAWRRVFRAHAEDAAITLGPLLVDDSHAGALYESLDPEVLPGGARRADRPVDPKRSEPAEQPSAGPDRPLRRLSREWPGSPTRAADDARALATIRRAAARDAINVLALADVVAALVVRKIPIKCPVIADGTPRRYVWRASQRRFVESSASPGKRLSLTLLAPSESLVRRHWTRLPIGEYVARAREADIPILTITPSNQLSLVTRFGVDGQGILVCGDSGFMDFAGPDGTYAPALLARLLPLQVVQVAHHAGNNGHFYRVLLAAGFADQADDSLLLVSHATRDRHRPSPPFGQFVLACRAGRPDALPGALPRIVFTSKPSIQKVRAYRDAIHPVVGGAPQLVGDVRLAHQDGAWTVVRHAVRV